ncbi:O-antigen ligase family protein [Paenibacillus alvei]|uniref:O-antigen ligase family protein n=1 Tax=Paenibacillus alvei TaxID=44250 RepID=UPI00227E45A7|nr:O-antigen ligase family protein [Paenibacillus alvei]MCY7483588.1 O-antigen ligase family protein [Paenibacillus alvei]
MKAGFQRDGDSNLVILYIGIGILFAVLLVALWRQGLFYDRDVLVLSLLLCAVSAGMLVKWKSNWEAALPLPLMYPLLLMIGYSVNWALGPATVYGTQMQFIRNAMLLAWIVLLAIVLNRGGNQAKRNITGILLFVGFLISISALSMLYGWVPNESGVMVSGNSELSALGFRLGGIVQYPNTLGVLAGAFALYHLNETAYIALQARASVNGLTRRSFKQWLIIAVPLVPHLAVLGLSESRGSWIVFSIVWAVGIWRAQGHRIAYVLTFLWFGAWSFAAASWSASIWQSGKGWLPLPLLVAWIASIMLFGGVLLYRSRIRWLQSGLFAAIMLLLLLCSSYLLPTGASSRITDHYATAGARTMFYKDALVLWREHPWFGSGGDAWRQQFSRIQSQPYVGKEVHSSLLDMLLDVGLVWTLAVVSLLIAAWIMVWRRHAGWGMAAAMVLAHSLLDFDMAYGLVGLLLAAFLTLGMYDDAANMNSKAISLCFMARHTDTNRSKQFVALLLAVPLAAAVVLASCHLVAQQLAAAASAAADRATGAAGLARAHAQQEAALRWAPANTALRIAVSRTLPPREALALLEEGLRYERDGKGLYRALALASMRLGRANDAAAWWEAAVSSDRFDRTLQTEAVEKLALAAHLDANREQAALYATAASRLYRRYESEVLLVQRMHKPANDKRFALTEEAKRAYGSIASYRMIQ